MSSEEDAEEVEMNWLCLLLWLSVSRGLDEPGSHPPPQRQAAGSRSQLPPSAWSEARWHHHPVQLAQAVEHHGETGPADHEPLTSLHLPPPRRGASSWNKEDVRVLPPILLGKDKKVSGRLLLQSDLRGSRDLHPPLGSRLPSGALPHSGRRSEGKYLDSEGLSSKSKLLTGTTLLFLLVFFFFFSPLDLQHLSLKPDRYTVPHLWWIRGFLKKKKKKDKRKLKKMDFKVVKFVPKQEKKCEGGQRIPFLFCLIKGLSCSGWMTKRFRHIWRNQLESLRA